MKKSLFVDEATIRDIQRETANPYWSLIHDDNLGLMLEARDAYLEQIAEELNKSINTIKTHRSRLLNKLHVNSMPEAFVFVSNYDLY